MGFTYVVEHLEEDERTTSAVPEWVQLEYSHMLTLAGPSSRVWFTNLSAPAQKHLSGLRTATSAPCAEVAAHTVGVLKLLNEEVPLERVCLLDPKAEKELSPDDGDGRFAWFLFGGILGDDPPRDRTAQLRTMGFPARRLGPVQMTTDTALGVAKMVVEDKVPLSGIPYVDFPTIRFNKQESVEMPFRYFKQHGEPLLPPGMKEHLQKDLDRGFEL